jgi:hypothetical protein
LSDFVIYDTIDIPWKLEERRRFVDSVNAVVSASVSLSFMQVQATAQTAVLDSVLKQNASAIDILLQSLSMLPEITDVKGQFVDYST